MLTVAWPAAVAAVCLTPAVSRAQATDSAVPEVENARHSLECQVNITTFVRSGPSDTFYPTQKIDKGATVVVVGKKGNWLKIQAPEGSFSYVAKAWVNKYGDGKTGKVTTPTLIVRAGSSVQPQMQSAVQTRLEMGQDVTILGEENEYFKIRPPASAFLYIKADEVSAIREVPKPGERSADPQDLAQDTPSHPVVDPIRHPRSEYVTTPQTRPGDVAEAPTTGPSTESVERLQKLEADFMAASNMPLAEQPIDALLAGYESLASSPALPEPTRKMADARAATLKVRAEARDQFLVFQKQQQDQDQKMQAQAAERQEIQERIKRVDVRIYTAVGTLRPSSLQVGNGPVATRATLFRLTDPETGRTVVYIRTPDPRYNDMIGQFVGVRGDIAADPQLNLKVIAPTVTETVDPGAVNGSVAAQIIPPSLEAKAPTASTGAEQK